MRDHIRRWLDLPTLAQYEALAAENQSLRAALMEVGADLRELRGLMDVKASAINPIADEIMRSAGYGEAKRRPPPEPDVADTCSTPAPKPLLPGSAAQAQAQAAERAQASVQAMYDAMYSPDLLAIRPPVVPVNPITADAVLRDFGSGACRAPAAPVPSRPSMFRTWMRRLGLWLLTRSRT